MTRVFGRVHSMKALVITGNGNGLAGYALGKVTIYFSKNSTVVLGGNSSNKQSYCCCYEHGQSKIVLC